VKISKLICPKCGNTERFRVDVQLTLVSTLLTFREDIYQPGSNIVRVNEADLDLECPNDVSIECPVCEVCGTEVEYIYRNSLPKGAMCPSCIHYVNADVVETCPMRERKYPDCFMWAEPEAELDL